MQFGTDEDKTIIVQDGPDQLLKLQFNIENEKLEKIGLF